jgi:hypothetical protein
MRLLLETAIIFFGTLMAAALVALGGPVVMEVLTAQAMPPQAHDAAPVMAAAQLRALQDTNPAPPGG